ncbi:hypothetical protein LJK87_17435 [Paenibacillus sp. P25]|nr:hypothetical protein LJK87_17435 [Paenibacillus sp. P25]
MDLNRLKEELEKVKADFQTVVAQIAYFQNLQQATCRGARRADQAYSRGRGRRA